jgi:hypothetical protein
MSAVALSVRSSTVNATCGRAVPVFACSRCGSPLDIEADGAVDPADLEDPGRFMTLRYQISSTARWACPIHGPVAPVSVAVVDEHAYFVPPEPGRGGTDSQRE